MTKRVKNVLSSYYPVTLCVLNNEAYSCSKFQYLFGVVLVRRDASIPFKVVQDIRLDLRGYRADRNVCLTPDFLVHLFRSYGVVTDRYNFKLVTAPFDASTSELLFNLGCACVAVDSFITRSKAQLTQPEFKDILWEIGYLYQFNLTPCRINGISGSNICLYRDSFYNNYQFYIDIGGQVSYVCSMSALRGVRNPIFTQIRDGLYRFGVSGEVRILKPNKQRHDQADVYTRLFIDIVSGQCNLEEQGVTGSVLFRRLSHWNTVSLSWDVVDFYSEPICGFKVIE